MRVDIMSSSKKTTSSKEDDAELRRGPWTLEEDTLLVHYIALMEKADGICLLNVQV
jgi:myb proto-oncogene protein